MPIKQIGGLSRRYTILQHAYVHRYSPGGANTQYLCDQCGVFLGMCVACCWCSVYITGTRFTVLK